MEHYMMLSDLYGRIGQILKEHGDAPIGRANIPVFPENRLPIEWIRPIYCTFTHITLTLDKGINIEYYEPVIDDGNE